MKASDRPKLFGAASDMPIAAHTTGGHATPHLLLGLAQGDPRVVRAMDNEQGSGYEVGVADGGYPVEEFPVLVRVAVLGDP